MYYYYYYYYYYYKVIEFVVELFHILLKDIQTPIQITFIERKN